MKSSIDDDWVLEWEDVVFTECFSPSLLNPDTKATQFLDRKQLYQLTAQCKHVHKNVIRRVK